MAFSTKVIVDTSPDFGDNPQETTESGKPASASLQGLTPNTYHWTKAELYEDGTKVATSEVETFQTLPVGSMTVAYGMYSRASCNKHLVTYTYTSTYAPSSAVLHVTSAGGFTANYQGAIDSANNTILFDCDDWTGGVVYSCTVTLTDIYGESQTSSATSVTSATMNTISCAVVSVTETSVTLSIEKCLDGGFSSGRADWWLETDEPDYEPSRGHVNFLETDTTVTITGLTADTEYIFNVSATLTNTHIVVSSAYVHATTSSHDYSNDYLTVTNTSQESGVLTFNTGYQDRRRVFEYSMDGTTWYTKTIQYSSQTIQIGAGESVMLRGDNTTNGFSPLGTTPAIEVNKTFTVSGNLMSVWDKYNFKTLKSAGDVLTPGGENYVNMSGFFQHNTNLVSAENLTFGVLENIYYGMFQRLFSYCENLVTPPKTMPFISIDNGFLGMFSHCTSLTTAPTVPNLTTVKYNGMQSMFLECTSLVNGMDISGVTYNESQSFDHMYYNCTALLTAYTANGEHYRSNDYLNWLQGVETNGTLYIPNQVLLNEFPYSVSGCPGNWTKTLKR